MRNRLTRAGTRRAQRLGWPNTYTFTKSLGESLLATRGAGLPIAVARPSIVETSTHEPFRGWNEGINTSAPLSYLLGTYFRQLPSNERKCLDLIPVDMVCRGMTLIAAALIERRHQPLYQLATSASNPCDMGRSIELTALAHRKHYRAQQGLEHWLRMRFETIPVSKERYRKLSVPAQKVVIQGINRAASALQFKRPPLARQERDLARVEKLIELYEPFILHNEQVFESENVQLLSAALPENERAQFAYEPSTIDWWDYWINIHVPALRKWCYPLIEGHAIESRQRREFHFPDSRSRQRRTRARSGTRSHMAIFLTGATGYIGSYLAAGLLERHGESLNRAGARRRRRRSRAASCGRRCSCTSISRRFASTRRRIRIFLGDLTAPQFGLDDADYRALADSTDSVLALRCFAQSQIRKKLPERQPARHARSHTAGPARARGARAAPLQRGQHRGRGRAPQQRSGHRRPRHRLGALRLRSLRAHQEILRAHGARAAARRAAHRFPPEHRAGRQPPAGNHAVRHGARVCVSGAGCRCCRCGPTTGSTSCPRTTLPTRSSHLHQKPHPEHEIYHLVSGTDSETFRQLTEALARARGKMPPLFWPGLDGAVRFGGRLAFAAVATTWATAPSLLKVFLPYLVWNTVFDNTRVVRGTGPRARAVFLLLLSACCVSPARTASAIPTASGRAAGRHARLRNRPRTRSVDAAGAQHAVAGGLPP